jgi:hypothetical protein
VTEKPQLLDWFAQQAETADLSGLGRTKVSWGFRAVHPDFRSRDGYRYPWPGQWAKAPGPILNHPDSCPQGLGDGLCIAKTFYGAGLGGIPPGTYLLVGYTKRDVLGEDDHKIRVKRMYVADVLALRTILGGAYLGGADLRGADLRGAYLGGAYLGGAYLYGAYLGGAYLGGAYLYGANLGGADLGGADLGGANLGGADLRGADLRGAYLYGATYSQLTLWPEGFDVKASGAVLV